MPGQINPLPVILQNTLLRTYSIALGAGILKTGPGNKAFEWAYHFYKDWLEAKTVDRLRPYVLPNSTVIDVGANAGFFTRRFARWLHDSGIVVAIEPEKNNIARLRNALAKDQMADRVKVIEAVAVEKPGELMLKINPTHPGDHRIGDDGVVVNAITLDEIVESEQLPQVSLIKIDVQGAEVRVLDGAQTVLSQCRPAIFMEVDPRALEEQGGSVSDLAERLERASYQAYVIGKGEAIQLISFMDLSARLEKHSRYADVLCLPAETNVDNK